jgi:hypothetical protein
MSQLGKALAQVPKYQYDALPHGQFIRMLILYPGALTNPLEGEPRAGLAGSKSQGHGEAGLQAGP